MKTFVITLPDAIERQKQIDINFKKHNIVYEFISGVEIKDVFFEKDLSGFYFEDEFFKFDLNRLYKYIGRAKIKFGEIAALLAHYRVWKKIKNCDDKKFLICEDDCLPANTFLKSKLDSINIEKYGFCHLQAMIPNFDIKKPFVDELPSIEDDKNIKVISKNKDPICMGAAAYMISKDYALNLLQYVKNAGYDGPIDNLFLREEDFKVHCPSDIDNYFILDETAKHSYAQSGNYDHYCNPNRNAIELYSNFEIQFINKNA